MPEPSAAELIDGALEFLSEYDHWGQNVLFQDEAGQSIPIEVVAVAPEKVKSVCLWGGILKSYCDLTGQFPGDDARPALKVCHNLLEDCVVRQTQGRFQAATAFNDSRDHTAKGYWEVVSVLACAKEKAHA